MIEISKGYKVHYNRLNDEDISKIISTIPINKNQKNLDQAKKYFKKANTDLNRAKKDFMDKAYPYSIFNLQQAVEKAAKSFGLFFGIIGNSDLRKISHKEHKIFLILLKILELENRKNNSAFQIFIVKHISTMEGFIDISQNRESTYDLIENTIDQISNIEKEYQNIKKDILKKENIEELEAILDQMNDIVLFIIEMMYLAFITEIHESSSRYLDEDNNSPDDTYIRGNPIVDNLPVIMKIAEKSFKRYNNFFKNPQQSIRRLNIEALPKVVLDIGEGLNEKMAKKS